MTERSPQNRTETHTRPRGRTLKERFKVRRSHAAEQEATHTHPVHDHHNHEAHNHSHSHHDHHKDNKLVNRKWQIGTVAGNAIIGAAEIATGRLSTLSVAADGFHNFGDAFTYYTQTESILNNEQSDERKKKLRKLGYWILFGTSAAIAAKTAYDVSTNQEHESHPFTIYAASASLALNSVLASTMYRRYRKRNNEGIQDEHEHDIVKHLITDSASAALAFGGALAQKYGINDLEPYAALGGAAITGWAFRPTKNNLEHNHDHFSDNHDHGHGHHAEHGAHGDWKQIVTPIAARLAYAVIDSEVIATQKKKVSRKQRSAFASAKPEKLQAYIKTANEVSLESRRRSYEGDNQSFEQRNQEWNAMYWNQMQELVADSQNAYVREQRIAALHSLGLDAFDITRDETGGLYVQVEQFRQKYVGSQGSDIGKFVEDISSDCKNTDGTVSLHTLESRLSAIEPMLNAFGTEYDVHLLVKDFAIVHGMLSYNGKKGREIAAYAAKQIRTQTSEHYESRLRALHVMHSLQQNNDYVDRGITDLESYANSRSSNLLLAS
jgi:Co/Zn/Cd efflux system component